jgi:quinol monooxygenase YgiN
MATLFIRHKIKNYPKWKKTFDAFAATRRAGGERSYRIGHVPGKPNNLCLLFDWDSAANAAKFMKSKALRAAMQEAGVTERPEVFIFEEIDKGKP